MASSFRFVADPLLLSASLANASLFPYWPLTSNLTKHSERTAGVSRRGLLLGQPPRRPMREQISLSYERPVAFSRKELLVCL